MKATASRLLRTLAVLLLAGLASGAWAGDHSDIVGAWRVLGKDDQGEQRGAVLYFEEVDGELTGQWAQRGGAAELHDVRYDDGRLSFWWYVDIQTTMIKLRFTADVKGDEFDGELREPNTVGRVKGRRIRHRPHDESKSAGPAEDESDEPGSSD